MTHWKKWARKWLAKMEEHGLVGGAHDDCRAVLRHHAEHGGEPYYTLRAYIFLHMKPLVEAAQPSNETPEEP